MGCGKPIQLRADQSVLWEHLHDSHRNLLVTGVVARVLLDALDQVLLKVGAVDQHHLDLNLQERHVDVDQVVEHEHKAFLQRVNVDSQPADLDGALDLHDALPDLLQQRDLGVELFEGRNGFLDLDLDQEGVLVLLHVLELLLFGVLTCHCLHCTFVLKELFERGCRVLVNVFLVSDKAGPVLRRFLVYKIHVHVD